MNTKSFRDWYSKRVQVADTIVHNGLGAAEDAEILLCCANSALASLMWPGRGIDKFRFTQFLIDFAPDSVHVETISVPVLIAKLKESGDNSSTQTLIREFYPQSDLQILDGEQVDQAESAITNILSGLSLKDIRQSSYAGIIYNDLRSGLVHEYNLSTYLKSFGMSHRTDIPSYVNMLVEPSDDDVSEIAQEFEITEHQARTALAKRERHLYVPYDYLRSVLIGAADSAFNYWESTDAWERSSPLQRWIEGESK